MHANAEEGDSIEITMCQHMMYDVEDMPILDYVEINGILEFVNDDVDRTFRAKHIFVRAGQFLIGKVDEPFTAIA